MKKGIKMMIVMAAMSAVLAVTGCGSSSSSGPDSVSCPGWNVGDTMTYLRTETVGTVSTSATVTWTVTEHTADTAVLSSGTSTWTYTVAGGKYIPASESPDTGMTSTYTSTTAFCPPPSTGASYEYTTWIPSAAGRGGDLETRTLYVANESVEPLAVPVGSFTARKLIMDKTSTSPFPLLPDSTVIRFYADGIGVVKEVEEIPSTGTTITKELTSYSFR